MANFVKAWESADGKLFGNPDDAERHDIFLGLKEELISALVPHSGYINSDLGPAIALVAENMALMIPLTSRQVLSALRKEPVR